jgi:hypothetical protein
VSLARQPPATAHAAVLACAPRSWPHRESSLTGLLLVTTSATVAEAALLPGRVAALLQVGVVAWIGSLAYATWHARFGRRPTAALTPDALLPNLCLQTVDGEDFSTDELRGVPADPVAARPRAARRPDAWHRRPRRGTRRCGRIRNRHCPAKLVLLDASGHVIAADETDTYPVRPNPGTVLELLDAALTPGRTARLADTDNEGPETATETRI